MFETCVIDNLVDANTQVKLHEKIMTADWKFLSDVSGVQGQTYPSHGFAHVLKHPDTSMHKISPLYDDVSIPILNAIKERGFKVSQNYYNRSFLQLPLAAQYKKEHNGIHVDLPPSIKHVACVYYINNSDGDTIIYDQTITNTPGGSNDVALTEHMRVKPTRGRIVMFDGSRYHCSSQPTINYRCIINFDLIMDEQ